MTESELKSWASTYFAREALDPQDVRVEEVDRKLDSFYSKATPEERKRMGALMQQIDAAVSAFVGVS